MQQVLYAIKVWITTIVTGSIGFTLYDLYIASHSPIGEFFGAIFPLLIANLIIGVPALLAFYIACEQLSRLRLSVRQRRWAVITSAFALFLLSWYGLNSLFGRDVFFETSSIVIYAVYLASIIGSCLLFEEKLPGPE